MLRPSTVSTDYLLSPLSWCVRGSQDETSFLYAGSNFPESEASETDFKVTNEGRLVCR